LITRFEKRGVGVFIIIFSQSGIAFAKAMPHQAKIYKSPWDFIWIWKKLFKVLDLSMTFVIRHELWPAFLTSAKEQGGKLVLIDAVLSSSQGSIIGTYLKRWLYRKFDIICAVQQMDQEILSTSFRIPSENIHVTGDTKYDRVFERIEERATQFIEIQTRLDEVWVRQKRMIIGSAWPADVELILPYFAQTMRFKSWQLIIAPHDVNQSMIETFSAECHNHKLTYMHWSEVQKSPTTRDFDVLIIDTLGILAELYQCANLAFVGGALHHRVHNVLEPACRGLGLGFGPHYQTSQEAKWLVERGLATVVKTMDDLDRWWFAYETAENVRNKKLLIEVRSLCGASDHIFQILSESF
jgi:3-deoxy-D-manno-octulosonic-acid transferase